MQWSGACSAVLTGWRNVRATGKERADNGKAKEDSGGARMAAAVAQPMADRSAQDLAGLISTLCHLVVAHQRESDLHAAALQAQRAVHTALEVRACSACSVPLALRLLRQARLQPAL